MPDSPSQTLADVDTLALDRLTPLAADVLARSVLNARGGAGQVDQPGSGAEFLDYAPFEQGSDARRIDWKASGRAGTMLTRRNVDERGADWWLCLDGSALMAGAPWRLAIQIAAALAYLALQVGCRTGVLVFSDDVDDLVPLGRGRLQYARILRHLRDRTPGTAGGGSQVSTCLRYIRGAQPLVVISDFLAPDAMSAQLSRMSRGRVARAIHITDRSASRRLPAGPHALEDAETGERLAVTVDERSVAHMHDSERALAHALARLAAARGIHITSADTGDTWQAAVLTHLTARVPGVAFPAGVHGKSA